MQNFQSIPRMCGGGPDDDNKTANKTAATGVGFGCFLLLIMLPVGILLRGYVLTSLWTWFVVPFGVMPIGMAHAYGLSALITMFHGAGPTSKEDKEGSTGVIVGRSFGVLVFAPLWIWLLGYIFHSFM